MATPKLPPTWRITFMSPEAWAISRREISAIDKRGERGEKHAHGDPAEVHGHHDLGMFRENGEPRIQKETEGEEG